MGKSEKVVAYYSNYDEQGRLANVWGQVEFIRTCDIIDRYLPESPAVVLDVGGAAGRYACWLAERDYDVHLVDPVPLHVEQAQAASAAQPEAPIGSCRLGDARQLDFDDQFADAVLLLGPLYHLTEAPDRQAAISEAFRVLKSGGHLFAAGISQFASTIDGLASGYSLDPEFQKIMRRDLKDGQHRNPSKHPAYFMDAFFHHPDHLQVELTECGFVDVEQYAIEGMLYLVNDLDEQWNNPMQRAFLLEIMAEIEQEPVLIGASPHILCVGRKPRKLK